jgi:hypothetical protein
LHFYEAANRSTEEREHSARHRRHVAGVSLCVPNHAGYLLLGSPST